MIDLKQIRAAAEYQHTAWTSQNALAMCDEIESLRAELAESDALREKMSDILIRTANALKGEPGTRANVQGLIMHRYWRI